MGLPVNFISDVWISFDVFILCLLQNKYKEDGIKSLSQSLYSQLPETAETQLAKTVSELQSEVRNDQGLFKKSLFVCSFLFLYNFVTSLDSNLEMSCNKVTMLTEQTGLL